MNELFGIPLDTLLVILAVALGIAFGILAVLVVRNPVLFRLGVRNVGRRRGRTGLIVLGLMLGTTIVAAALVTGDTMSHTIRTTATAALGQTDEIVSARGAVDDIPGDLGQASGVAWMSDSLVGEIQSTLGPDLTDGVVGAVIDNVAIQAPRTRQTEPSVKLFAADPTALESFAPITGPGGETLSLAQLGKGEVYLNADAAKELGARAGDAIVVYPSGEPFRARVRAVVDFQGAGTADAALLLPLGEAQRIYDKPKQILGVMISNRGSGDASVALSDRVEAELQPVLDQWQLDVATVKQDTIEAADEAGSAFMAFFTTFGSFSIAAGILLIFLIFVMLAAERRGELGIARAIGTRRGHLVEMFTFEGAAYDLIAAAVGAILGAVIAYGMVFLMAQAFGAEDADAGLQVEFAFTWQSLLIAFALGVLLTLIVVAFSAWRVSVMTIAAAIRNVPEPPVVRRRRRVVLGGLGVALGLLLALTAGNSATPLMLGISLIVLSLVPFARLVGIPDRLAYTVAGIVTVVLWMLPWSVWESVFGPLSMDFSTWIVAGLMVVIGAVWVIVYNADLLLGAAMAVLGQDQGACSGPAHVDGVPAPEPLPDRHHPRHVHARRLHARHRSDVDRLVPGGVRQRGRLRRRLPDTSRDGSGRGDRRHALGARPASRSTVGRLSRRGEPVRARGRRASARDRPSARELLRARPRHLLPAAHDVRPRRDGEGLLEPPRRVDGARQDTRPGRRRRARGAAP